MKLKSALEAAGIKLIAKSNLDLQAAANYVAKYLNEYLGVRAVKNHVTMQPAEAAVKGFVEYAVACQMEHGTTQKDFMDEVVRSLATQLASILNPRGTYFAFTPGETLLKRLTEVALAACGNVHVRVTAWDDQSTNSIGCQIDVLCLAN